MVAHIRTQTRNHLCRVDEGGKSATKAGPTPIQINFKEKPKVTKKKVTSSRTLNFKVVVGEKVKRQH